MRVTRNGCRLLGWQYFILILLHFTLSLTSAIFWRPADPIAQNTPTQLLVNGAAREPSCTGRVAVVVGGGRGIGKAITLRIAAHSADEHIEPVTHIICLSRTVVTCEETANLINRDFPLPSACNSLRASAYGVDASDKSAIQQTMQQILAKFGRADILVNNAGITKDKLFIAMQDSDWLDVIRVNLNAVFYFSRSVIRPMMKQKWGRIVNIASISGLGGNPGQANYAAAKAGVIAFSKSLSKELANGNITVNAISPGFVATDMTKNIPEAIKKAAQTRIPVGRFGEPEELAAIVGFIVSDKAAYITGSSIVADGGDMFGMAT